MDTPIYLDHNASTPMDPAVIDSMTQTMKEVWANPSSSQHVAGNAAAMLVEEARVSVSKTIGCRPQEVIFCSGSTEANNLALTGCFANLRTKKRTHIITTAIEHPSVLECIENLRNEGAEISILPVDSSGRLKLKTLQTEIRDSTGLVSVMAANNETGICQPIEEVAELCATQDILFHTDYSQATAYREIDLQKSNVHLASFSGHKMYGPKGIGVLYVRLRNPRVNIEPLIHGGGQERGIRSGTLNTPAIVGLAKAFEIVRQRRNADSDSIRNLKSHLIEGLLRLSGSRLNGDQSDSLPNTFSISIESIEPLALMHILRNDVIFSSSSACSSDRVDISHVLRAMYGNDRRAEEAFRIGLGRYSTKHEVERTVACISQGVDALRSMSAGS